MLVFFFLSIIQLILLEFIQLNLKLIKIGALYELLLTGKIYYNIYIKKYHDQNRQRVVILQKGRRPVIYLYLDTCIDLNYRTSFV